MPRSDQLIQQWTILRLLEANGKTTLRRIAAELSDPCHERTLRRDLNALSLSGFPLHQERTNGTTYWVLSEDFRRFPLPLTVTELFALRCGKHLLAPLDGTFVTDSLQTLYQKINAPLDPKHREYLSQLDQTLRIGIPPYKTYQIHRQKIERIHQAISQGRTVELRYTALRSDRPSRREVNPYRLWYYNGTLYLIGYCNLRKEVRTFAVDRIDTLRITDERFQPPLYFSMEEYFKDSFGVFRGKAEAVTLVFDKPAARWVRERTWHASQKIAPLKGGKIRLELAVAVTPEVTQWVLGFGSQVEVVQPDHLRRAVENQAWRVLGRYQGIKMPVKRRGTAVKKV